jgi:NAD(P)H-dependent FMN reductase
MDLGRHAAHPIRVARKGAPCNAERMRVAIIVGSTRSTRKSEKVARWVLEQAEERNDFEAELVDLAEQGLPIFDEPKPPGAGDYRHEHTKRWATLIDSFDAYVFVTPEYNHGIPGVLKNALDFIYGEWNDKVAGFVAYGNTGGARSVEQLRLVMAELKVATVRSAVALSIFTDFDKDNNFTPADHHPKRLNAVFDEVVSWGEALKGVRESG